MPDRLLDEDPCYSDLGGTETQREEKYQQWIDSQISQGEWEEIGQATQRGHLIGRETFQKQVEAMTGRRLLGEAGGDLRRGLRVQSKKFSDPTFTCIFPHTCA
jgi:hypothetical protein